MANTRSLSSYYHRGSANQFPGHSDADLRRDLCSSQCDDDLRARIETELARRNAARAARKARRAA